MARSKSRRSSSSRRRRSGSIVPVRKGRKVIGFQKYVRGVGTRFLPESKWPRSRSTLQRLGVTESLEQIRENNRAVLARGRARRRRGSRSGTKKRSKSRSSTGRRRSKAVKSKSGRRRTRSRSKAGKMSPHERAFRKHYTREKPGVIGTTKKLRESMMYDAPSGVKKTLKADDNTYIENFLHSYTFKRPEFKGVTRKDVQEAVNFLRKEHRGDIYGFGTGDSEDYEKIERFLLKKKGSSAMGASVTRSSSHGASVRRRAGKRRISKRSRPRSASRRSPVSAKWRRSHPRSKSGQFVSPKKLRRRSKSTKSRRRTKSRKSHRRTKSRSSKRRDSRAWSKKKNLALRRLMKREFGKILSKDEYRALPKNVQRELQLQAYETAYPAKVKSSPDRLLSNKALSKRVSRRSKEASAKAKREAKKEAARQAKLKHAPKDAEGDYPGEEQAIKDFIQGYANKKYKTQAARVAAMTRDLKKSKNVVKRSTSYKAWKKRPDVFDLAGIDTHDSDDSFLKALRKPKKSRK